MLIFEFLESTSPLYCGMMKVIPLRNKEGRRLCWGKQGASTYQSRPVLVCHTFQMLQAHRPPKKEGSE